jgi:hypothetical protein
VCCCRHSRFRFPHGFKFNGRLLFSNRLLSMSAHVLCSAPAQCLIKICKSTGQCRRKTICI